VSRPPAAPPPLPRGPLRRLQLGVLADTHGLVRPEALAALAGADLILHAGDVGGPEVLERLARVAPVRAVRGNVDRGAWASTLPEARDVDLSPLRVRLLHDLAALDRDPAADGVAAVVFGHSHRPTAFERDNVLYLNPGSAGPRRFRLPVRVARLTVYRGRLCLEWVPLAGP